MSRIAPLVIAYSLVAGHAFAQEDRAAPVQQLKLTDGSLLVHAQYDGILRRIDKGGREVVRVRLPKAKGIEKTTRVVASRKGRLLVIHGDSLAHFPPDHLVMILDSMSLRSVAKLRLGDCKMLDPAPNSEQATLVCQQSQDPSNGRKKKTLAVVTLDVDRAKVTRWFDLGAERRGNWVGPMFFGYYDEAWPVSVQTDGCDTIQKSAWDSIDLPEHPGAVVVLARTEGSTRGEVWFVSADVTVDPRRIETLAIEPLGATLCGEVLYVRHTR